jgi:hypothetical protein
VQASDLQSIVTEKMARLQMLQAENQRLIARCDCLESELSKPHVFDEEDERAVISSLSVPPYSFTQQQPTEATATTQMSLPQEDDSEPQDRNTSPPTTTLSLFSSAEGVIMSYGRAIKSFVLNQLYVIPIRTLSVWKLHEEVDDLRLRYKDMRQVGGAYFCKLTYKGWMPYAYHASGFHANYFPRQLL